MSNAIRNAVSTSLLAAAFAAAPSFAMTKADLAGTVLAASGPVERVINVDSSTRWVNVSYGDTVRFVVNSGAEERSFVFRFDGTADNIGLADISPDGVRAANVPVYINQTMNPLRTTSSY